MAATLQHSRRARQARASHPAPVAPHTGNPADQPRRSPRSGTQDLGPRLARDDGALRVHDSTVRRHWEAARKVNIHGDTVALDPDGPLAEAAWAKQRLGRATQALPNGYCGLPVQKSCPHANACLTCPMFLTTPEFLPQHRQQRQQVLQLITAADARGQQRLAEMNQQVLGNLDRIITSLTDDEDHEQDDEDHERGASDAS